MAKAVHSLISGYHLDIESNLLSCLELKNKVTYVSIGRTLVDISSDNVYEPHWLL